MDLSAVIAVLLFKLASISAGVFFAWMGYRLFMSGIWGNAGELEEDYKTALERYNNAEKPGKKYIANKALKRINACYEILSYRNND